MPKTTQKLTLSLKDLHKDYLLTNPPILEATYRAIVMVFFEHLIKEMFTGKVFKFPYMGIFGIFKIKYINKVLNYKIYNNHNIAAMENNFHTDGHRVKFQWLSYHVSITTKNLLKFRPARTANRALAKLLKTTNSYNNFHDLNDYRLYSPR